MANDANCLAVSEATDGAAAGARVVFAVIIGTGCGAGIALDGRVHAGGNGIAGEWGHNPLPWQDDAERAASATAPCYCGKHGCIETFVSGSGFCADYRCHGGAVLDGARIMALADAGDVAALAAIARYEQRLARALAQTINTLDPDVIVLGGGMSNVSRLYRTLPDLITPGYSAVSAVPRFVRRSTATPAGYAAPRGCGPRNGGMPGNLPYWQRRRHGARGGVEGYAGQDRESGGAAAVCPACTGAVCTVVGAGI